MSRQKERLSLASCEYPTLSPNLIEAQLSSFKLFLEEGIKELFDEISPITDYTGEAWELTFEDLEFEKPERGFKKSMRLGLSYDQSLYINTRLLNKKTGEIKKQRLFLVDMPVMSDRATFGISGNERVVVMQITRAEGILFYQTKASSRSPRPLYGVKLMPTRGRWFDFEFNRHGVMSVKLLDKRPKIFLTTLLRAVGYSSDEELTKLLAAYDKGETKLLESTFRRDTTKNTEEALLEIYRKLRPEDSISIEAAKEFLHNLLFEKRRFYLGRIGRYQLNKKLGRKLKMKPENYVLQKEDLLYVVRALLQLNSGDLEEDDIDHLANRRIRGVGELIADHIRVGVLRMEKNIRDRMGTHGTDELITPSTLVNSRPLIASVNQFFGSSQLSRYMDQENVLSEVETKRRITAGGPGGLTKERATFSVRDVHHSSYSRLCPVTTPEGPSIGIVSHMSVYARINEFGFFEAPYYRVLSNVKLEELEDESILEGCTLREDAKDEDGEVILKKGDSITKNRLKKIKESKLKEIKVEPKITEEVVYITPDDELKYHIASATSRNEENEFVDDNVFVRFGSSYRRVPISEVDFIDINPGQIAGLGLSLVPFSFNDDPTRALMAANMQRQAVPLLNPESPIVGTGFEKIIADASKRVVRAKDSGKVVEADASKIKVEYKDEEVEYEADKFIRTNQNTTFCQQVKVSTGEKVSKGDVLIDGPSMENGELALGKNLMAAFMIYEGYNYEDGIIISERLVKDDVLTSIHIKEYSQDVRDTKLGKELITSDIPNVGTYLLRNLDEEGIVRIGASVESRDILVGIIAPKGEVELTAEEKLLRAIFGEYSRDVRDNSLRLPHGDKGIVVGVQILDKEKGDKLNPGVLKQVKVWVARTQKISVGDKLTGLHGDKGVISKVLPEADMPYMKDGTPIDIILSPMFVKRMNIGQIKEMHIASQAKKLGKKVEVPPFTPIDNEKLLKELKKEGIDWTEKVTLFDGRTGKPYDKKVAVGPRYILKLNHLSSDKIHSRSTGPYTVVTQQPLGGKAQFGGQRFGEMEVWALEAHAVPNVLQEMLTIKSDDVSGRASAYKSIIQGLPIDPPSTPESFKVFVSEMRALGVNLDPIEKTEEPEPVEGEERFEEDAVPGPEGISEDEAEEIEEDEDFEIKDEEMKEIEDSEETEGED
ncbi:DNA-directed RNA polymerase subunit beta [Candidatus Dojkabacteria bacterium]|nr:DNA-directed RNA polymerase subunit beta [Candidatus Dojkabacteria bacterium]